jgi:hypothetical protein
VVWDPEGTLGRALWIGGGQWAGKSTVSRILARRYGLTVLDYDFQDERAHQDRRVVDRLRRGLPPPQPYPHEHWVTADPEAMAAEALADFRIRFNWLLDDLRSLYSPRPIIAEGWALRPELVAPILDSPRRMVVLVPTEEWRQKQLLALPRAAARVRQASDPEQAQRNRMARDRLVAEDAVRNAHAHGIRVITVDGSIDAEGIADILADHFSPYLPPPEPAGADRTSSAPQPVA